MPIKPIIISEIPKIDMGRNHFLFERNYWIFDKKTLVHQFLGINVYKKLYSIYRYNSWIMRFFVICSWLKLKKIKF